MADKPKAIVLGGTIPHKALIERLKKRGYETILIDYFEHPPAAEAADLHVRESAMDKEKVLQIAKEIKADLVICTCLDQQIVVACYVAEQLGLPRPYSLETAQSATNKEQMKRKMIEHEIPTSSYVVVNDLTQIETIDLKLPIIVKPADSNGAAGVTLVEQYDDLKQAIKEALRWSRAGTAIIEEFVEGVEVSVYTYIQDNKAHVLLTSQRFSELGEKDDCVRCYCSIAPANISPSAYGNMQKISDKIADAFGLNNTPMFYQSIVQGDDVSVIEFAPRLGGGLCYRTIEETTGFDIMDASIDSYLSNQVALAYTAPRYYYLTHQIHGYPCTFDHLEGFDGLLRNQIVDEVYYHKSKGAKVSDDKSSGARIAAFLIRSEDRTQFPAKAKMVVDCVDVYDMKNNKVTDRTLYLKESDL